MALALFGLWVQRYLYGAVGEDELERYGLTNRWLYNDAGDSLYNLNGDAVWYSYDYGDLGKMNAKNPFGN